MDEAKVKRRRKKAEVPDRPWVIMLTHRRKLGARIFLAPDPDRPHTSAMSKCSTLRYAARFESERAARKWLKVYSHPDYRASVGRMGDAEGRIIVSKPRKAADTKPFAFMEE